LSQKNATFHSAIVIFSLLFSGCALTVGPASFQEAPQTVRRGSLLGPFDGKVRDASTGYAIRNARVSFIWNVSRNGRQTPVVRATRTDINGRYYMPALHFNPGFAPRMPFCRDSVCRERIDDVQLVVEHPDYLPYVGSLAVFWPVQASAPGSATLPVRAGTEFYQLDNLVHLAKLTPGTPLHRMAAILALAGTQNAGADEIYYRAGAELTRDEAWELDASGLLSAQDARTLLERDERPDVQDNAAPDAFSRVFRFDMDEAALTMNVLYGPVSLLARWVRDGAKTAQRVQPADELDAEIWTFTQRAGGRNLIHMAALLPRDGLLLSLSCPDTVCRPDAMTKLVQRMAARKRSIRIVQKDTNASLPILGADRHREALQADRANWLHAFTDARLHHWIQSMFSMPLGIYEPLDIRHAERLQQQLGELPATLVLAPDSRRRIRILALLVDGALHRAMELQSARPPAGPSREDVLKLLRAAILEPRDGVRQHLAAQAFFALGRHLVPDAPAPGTRTRLQAFLDVLRQGRGDTADGERGWILFEHPDGRRQSIPDPAQLRAFSRGRILLLFSSGKTRAFPWPPAAEFREEYPQSLQFSK